MHPPPTLLLDLDGTLVHSVPDLADALNRLMASCALAPFSEPAVTAMVGDGARALVERAFAARGLAMDEPALAGFLADYTDHAAIRSRPYPGTEEALRVLQASGWRLAVCTNKPTAAARAMLAALGLAPCFAAITGADSAPARKPDPAHLLAALSQAGGDPARAVMLGDHHNDVEAARRAGIPALFARWGYGAPTMAAGAPILASIADLPAAAARLVTPGSPRGENAHTPAAPSPD